MPSSSMWDLLGFKESPYDTRPLQAISEDEHMLVGRTEDATKFISTLDSRSDGVVILSGPPGVGKTSFLNVQQFRLSTGSAPFGPRVLPAYFLTPINSGDEAKDVAEHVVQNLVKSIETYCQVNGQVVPEQARKIRKWISSPGATGFDFGIQILGFGGNVARNVEVPSLASASFESLQDVIAALVAESVVKLGVDSVILVLDNIENLEDAELQKILMTFRDSLFSVRRAWWVLIGQSGLGSLIRELDPRVADRIEGEGIELGPITLDELHTAVKIRIERFSRTKSVTSPVPESIHKKLYEDSRSEIRFVFKYANSICRKYVEDIRNRVLRILAEEDPHKPHDRKGIEAQIASNMLRQPLSETLANGLLQDICRDELAQSSLSAKEISVLHRIGERGSARGKDHDAFGIRSNQQFSSQFLVPLRRRQFLSSLQQGAGVIYTLRGLAAVAYTYGLLRK